MIAIRTIPAQSIAAKLFVDLNFADVEDAQFDGVKGWCRMTLPQANALIEALSKAVVEAQK